MLITKYGKILQVDDALLASQDNSTKRLRALTDYQCALLLAQMEYLKWASRYLNLQRSLDAQLKIISDTEKELMDEIDICALVDECLAVSETIINITNEINIINQNITNISQEIVNLGDEITNNITNTYPPLADAGSDALCQAAHYLARQLVGEIVAAWLDAASISLQEWVTALLGIGGWNGSLLVTWWDWMIATSDPDFITEAEAATDEIAQALFCANLSLLEFSLVLPSLPIDANVKESLGYLLNSIEDGKVALWIATGQLTESGNSCDSCGGLSFIIAKSAVNGVNAGTLAGAGVYNSAFTGEGTQQHRIRLVVASSGVPTTATINFRFPSTTDTRLIRVNTLAGAAATYNVTGQGTLLRNSDQTWLGGVTYSNSGAQVIEIANQISFTGVEIWIT